MKNTPQQAEIPQFSLYGEQQLHQDPGFVHIEDIATRSYENGWLIKPHRHGRMFQLLIMYEGSVEVQFDDISQSLSGLWAVTIPAGVVHGFKFTPQTKGVVLTLAEPILSDQSHDKSQCILQSVTQLSQTIEFHKKDALFLQLKQYLNAIQTELELKYQDQQIMLEWLVRMVLITLKRQVGKRQFKLQNSKHSQLLNTFRELLNQHYCQQWKVQQYGDAMNISVSSLNRLCHEHTGLSSKAIIQERVLIEAKRKLTYTRQTLNQIAYSLGFVDPAYFSRFFKKMTKQSPSEYRDSNNYETTNS